MKNTKERDKLKPKPKSRWEILRTDPIFWLISIMAFLSIMIGILKLYQDFTETPTVKREEFRFK